MKKIKKLLSAFIICSICTSYSYAANLTCNNLSLCRVKCLTTFPDGYCCTALGNQGTSTTCPTGWSLNYQGICSRNPTEEADSIGYYTQTYSSCSPTTTYYDCYYNQPNSVIGETCVKCGHM